MERGTLLSGLALASGVVAASPIIVAIILGRIARDGNRALRVYLAALVGPCIAVFLAGRHIMAFFRGLAQGGHGGIGSIAATMSEGSECVAAALAVSWLAALIAAIAASFRSDATAAGSATGTIVTALAGTAVAAIPVAVFRKASTFVMMIGNPNAKVELSIAESSIYTARLLLGCILGGIGAALIITVVFIVVPMFLNRPRRAVTLAILWSGQTLLGAAAVAMYRWARAFYEIAVTGTVPP